MFSLTMISNTTFVCGMASTNYSSSGIVLTIILFAVLIACGVKAKLKHTKQAHAIPRTVVAIPQVNWGKFPMPLYVSGLWTIRQLDLHGLTLFDDLRKQYGRIYKLPFGILNATVISDVKLVQKLLSSNSFFHLNKCKLIYKNFFMKELHGSTFVSNTQIWQPHRKCMSRGFSYKMLESYLPFISKGAHHLVQELCHLESSTVQSGELMEAAYKYVLQMTSYLLTGKQWDDVDISLIHERMQRHTDKVLAKVHNPFLFLPIKLPFLSKAESTCTEKTMQGIFELNIEYTQQKSETKGHKLVTTSGFKPVIEWMLENVWTKQEMIDNFAGFVLGEHEGTCSALQFTLFLLALYPTHQTACRNEINDLYLSADFKFSNLGFRDLCKLKYLERCILESMRLLPPIPTIARKIYTSLKINEGLTINAGTSIIVPIWAIHHDPEYYPNPEKFDPDRFLPDNVKQRQPGSYIPFSTGPRNCIGWKLALIQLKIILSEILHNFEVSTDDCINDNKLKFAIKSEPERKYNLYFKKLSAQK